MSTMGTEAFADFERNLRQWLARSEQLLVEPAPLPTEPVLLGLFEQQQKSLQSYLDQAERDVEQALSPLTAEIQALQQWLDELNKARSKLAECTTVPFRSD